jgi:alpha-1,2-mannosyltransferase
MRRLSASRAAALVWCAITVAMIAHALGVYSAGGVEGLKGFIQQGPLSDVAITFLSAALAWLLAGVFLILLARGFINKGNAVTAACFFVVALLYLNFLRERTVYGDILDYVKAAGNLYRGEPLHERYLYPPLWATLLKPLVPLGWRAIFDICWILNALSLFAFFFLLHATLKRYGFGTPLAAIVTAVFMLVNAPVIRTLCYVQVNFHVMNLILAALLLYPRSIALSALAMALAVHLKASPAVLALAFLARRDWKWLAWFAGSTIGVGVLTIAASGLSPYRDFLANARALYGAADPSFRESSIDSFVTALFAAFGAGMAFVQYLAAPLKILAAFAAVAVMSRSVRRETFLEGERENGIVLNAIPALLPLMLLLSPLMWEHHGVFLALPFLVMLKKLSSAGEWAVFGAAYFLAFLVPTFDFFPWSYGRLLAILAWLALAWRVSGRSGASAAFSRANAALERASL